MPEITSNPPTAPTEQSDWQSKICAVLDSFQARNEKPTQRKVIKEIGGSFGVVGPLLRAELERREHARAAPPTPDKIAEDAARLSASIWHAALVAARAEASGEIEMLRESLSRARDDVQALADRVEAAEAARDELKTALERASADYNSSAASATAQHLESLSRVQQRADRLDGDLQEASANLAAASQTISHLQIERAASAERESNLNTALAAANSAAEELRARVRLLEGELAAEVHAHQGTANNLDIKTEALRSTEAKLIKTIAEASSAIEAAAALRVEVGTLRVANASALSEISALRPVAGKLDQLLTAISELKSAS